MTERDETDAAVRRWVEGYVRAWDSNAPDDIRALFTDDGEYHVEPWGDPWKGGDEIVSGWLSRGDQAGHYTFEWSVAGVDGRRAFVEGKTVYDEYGTYHNLWVVDLADDGRATSFVEWWMKPKAEAGGAAEEE
jgi:hypothetical protein